MQKYHGSCHCGAVHFEIETDFPELTMCDCSICRRKNALMVKVHECQFRLIAGEDALVEYQFHTMTARHFSAKSAVFTHSTGSVSHPTTSVSTSFACTTLIQWESPSAWPPVRRWHE
jgi:hypothetical protein